MRKNEKLSAAHRRDLSMRHRMQKHDSAALARSPWDGELELFQRGERSETHTVRSRSERLKNQMSRSRAEKYAATKRAAMKRNAARALLWKYNRRSGMWDAERAVTDETASAWLTKFQKDEPSETFVIALHRPKRPPVTVKRNAKSGPADPAAASELILTTENESSLHPQFKAIEQSLQRKMRSGKYDHALAWKAWLYWVDAGAKYYAKHYGGSFNKNTRELAAKQVSDGWFEEMRAQGLAKNRRTSRRVRRNGLGGPYELVYYTGGHGGPYRTLADAEDWAEKLMKGSATEQWIAVVPAREVPTMYPGHTSIEGLLRRDKGWSRGGVLPRQMPRANKRRASKRTSRGKRTSRRTR